jgi:phosphotriesterase-related protein
MKTTLLLTFALMIQFIVMSQSASEFGGELMLETVQGRIPVDRLGLSLSHEHVLVDFVGAAEVSPDRYDADEVFNVVRPYLERVARRGVKTVFECTPLFLARDPVLLRRLAEATAVNLVTNTGLYGAVEDKFLPPWAYTETAEELATRWIAEARDGIDGTGIRPGFIKTAVDMDPELSSVDRKLIEAAAITHRATGLTIAVHTSKGPGLAILEMLNDYGVRAEAYVWVHAQAAPVEEILQAAAAGAWISLDGIRPSSLELHADRLVTLKEHGLLGQVLLSHDAGWFDPAKPGGGEYRGYELLFTDFLPMARERGVKEVEFDQVLVDNVARAFAMRPRLTGDQER